MNIETIKHQITDLYQDFFQDMKIDPKTGIIQETNHRFSGYPYIGDNYADAPIRLLFIPLDTGKDECYYDKDKSFHSFESRRDIFLQNTLEDYNPHIAGLYATALYILKDKMGWTNAWDSLWAYRNEYKTAKAIRADANNLPRDIMNYVAYENRYRFVTIGRGQNKEERSGGKDRTWLNGERERKMLLDEIDAFNPDIVIFQGKHGLWNCGVNGLRKKYKVIKMSHPSCWQWGADKLQYIVRNVDAQL